MPCILLYRLIFSAIPQTWVYSYSNLSFPSFLLIHLDRIPSSGLLYSSPSIRAYSFSFLILPPGPASFIFFFDFTPPIPLPRLSWGCLLEDFDDRMFLLSYPYQHVPSFQWYFGSQGGKCISKPVFAPLSVLYAKGLEFLL